MIEVTVSDLQTAQSLDTLGVSDFVSLVAETLKCTADEVSVALVDEEQIRQYNHDYRGLDQVTDVLSFALDDGPGPDGMRNIGDLVVCTSRAAEQAQRAGHDLWTELRILLLHGFLHLSGMEHPEAADEQGELCEMEVVEQKLRQQLITD